MKATAREISINLFGLNWSQKHEREQLADLFLAKHGRLAFQQRIGRARRERASERERQKTKSPSGVLELELSRYIKKRFNLQLTGSGAARASTQSYDIGSSINRRVARAAEAPTCWPAGRREEFCALVSAPTGRRTSGRADEREEEDKFN